MSVAAKLRGFWDDLFYSALVDRLETDLLLARSDAQQIRQDKDQTIAELRSEKAQLTATVALYQMNASIGATSSPNTTEISIAASLRLLMSNKRIATAIGTIE